MLEEYFRFILENKACSVDLKKLRHSLQLIEKGFDQAKLLEARDTANDPFANKNRKEELNRSIISDTLRANFKRGQEASRVLEEYTKLTDRAHLSERAKEIRFGLYALEKKIETT